MEDVSIQFAERYSRAIVVALSLIGSGFAPPGSAAAQSAQQLRWCNNEDDATSDMAIDGCTALIKSGNYSGRDLAYTNRGSAYDDKRDEDRAIADHDAAIRINPGFADAYNNPGIAYDNMGDKRRSCSNKKDRAG